MSKNVIQTIAMAVLLNLGMAGISMAETAQEMCDRDCYNDSRTKGNAKPGTKCGSEGREKGSFWVNGQYSGTPCEKADPMRFCSDWCQQHSPTQGGMTNCRIKHCKSVPSKDPTVPTPGGNWKSKCTGDCSWKIEGALLIIENDEDQNTLYLNNCPAPVTVDICEGKLQCGACNSGSATPDSNPQSPKINDADCQANEECKSGVCSDNKCVQGSQPSGSVCTFDEVCEKQEGCTPRCDIGDSKCICTQASSQDPQ